MSDTIIVWRVPLDSDTLLGSRLESYFRFLSDQERSVAEGLQGEVQKLEYVAAHWALRSILGQCLGIAPDQVQYENGARRSEVPDGRGAGRTKPRLLKSLQGVQDLNLRFNLSHTRGTALIAVAFDVEVGIDIEWHRPMKDLEGLARVAMSDREFSRWSVLEPQERLPGFYRLWTRKESYLKATGVGLYRNLQEISVPLSSTLPERCESGWAQVSDPLGVGMWSFADIDAGSEYSAALCWEGEQFKKVQKKEWLSA